MQNGFPNKVPQPKPGQQGRPSEQSLLLQLESKHTVGETPPSGKAPVVTALQDSPEQHRSLDPGMHVVPEARQHEGRKNKPLWHSKEGLHCPLTPSIHGVPGELQVGGKVMVPQLPFTHVRPLQHGPRKQGRPAVPQEPGTKSPCEG